MPPVYTYRAHVRTGVHTRTHTYHRPGLGRLPVERFYLEKVIYADPLRGATAAGNFSLLSEVSACGSNIMGSVQYVLKIR